MNDFMPGAPADRPGGVVTRGRAAELGAIGVASGAVAAVTFWAATGTDPLGVLGALRGIWDAISGALGSGLW